MVLVGGGGGGCRKKQEKERGARKTGRKLHIWFERGGPRGNQSVSQGSRAFVWNPAPVLTRCMALGNFPNLSDLSHLVKWRYW